MENLTDIDAILTQTFTLRTQLEQAKTETEARLKRIEHLLNALPKETQDKKVGNGGETLAELIKRALRTSSNPLTAREIYGVISALRPTEDYVIRTLLTRMAQRKELKREGTRGSFKYHA